MISLETPQHKWASCRLKGRTAWIFSSCGRCCGLKMGTSGTRSDFLRKGQSPCKLFGGISEFLSRQCRRLIPCVESVLEPENNSPVLTWFLGYFWSLPGESVLISSGAFMCTFLHSCSSSVPLPFARIQGSLALSGGFPTMLFHEEFPQGCPTCHRGVSRSSD